MTKKAVTTALVLFLLTVAAFAGGYVATMTANSSSSSSTQTAGDASSPARPAYSVADVAKHSSAGDCWFIISGKVYDVTKFIAIHPGGADTITPFCGQDATAAFDSERAHRATDQNSTANQLLEGNYKGEVK